MRSLRTAMRSSPRLLQLEKAHVQQLRPNTAKTKKVIIIIIIKFRGKKKETRPNCPWYLPLGKRWPSSLLETDSRSLSFCHPVIYEGWDIVICSWRRKEGSRERGREFILLLLARWIWFNGENNLWIQFLFLSRLFRSIHVCGKWKKKVKSF